MNVKLIGHFPYSRQTVMSDILMEEDKVVQIDGTPIPPTFLSFDQGDLDFVDYGYKVIPTLTVGTTVINELRELGGLDKKSLEIWGVGTPHWSR